VRITILFSPGFRNANSSTRDNLHPDSNETDSSNVHHPKHVLHRISNNGRIIIPFNLDFQKVNSSIHDNMQPNSNENNSSESQSRRHDLHRISTDDAIRILFNPNPNPQKANS
jgi:hypothetical protein